MNDPRRETVTAPDLLESGAHEIARATDDAAVAFERLRARFTELRAREYFRLDREEQTYLDYAGGGLYAESQVHAHLDLLESRVIGNPASAGSASAISVRLVERAREQVLHYFNASPYEYVVIFTQGTSAALKLVGESYPFAGGSFLATEDSPRAVHTMSELARDHGATARCVPVTPSELRVDEWHLRSELDGRRRGQLGLFTFPAQSSFSGVTHPLDWIEHAHERGWHVLLDAAAYVPWHRLDLRRWHPDFVALSFYKMFGYPTGTGCLLARWDALAHLRRESSGNGVPRDSDVDLEGSDGFEEGTIDYLNIPAIGIGLRHIEQIGIDNIQVYVMGLFEWLLEQLLAMHHSNGQPLIELYGPETMHRRGPSAAFSFVDPDGRPVDLRVIAQTARAEGISLRTGCHLGDGAWIRAPRTAPYERRASSMRRIRAMLGGATEDGCTRDRVVPEMGAVRVSLGVASNLRDVGHFVDYARGFVDVFREWEPPTPATRR